MKKTQKEQATKPQNDAARHARITCLVSDDEMAIIDSYLRKYKIGNKSRWMRETLLAFIHQNLDQDYPTLFNEHDMRR
jgi:cytochrome oxidase assembly protein ShyY1